MAAYPDIKKETQINSYVDGPKSSSTKKPPR